jgi:hypothetical protein
MSERNFRVQFKIELFQEEYLVSGHADDNYCETGCIVIDSVFTKEVGKYYQPGGSMVKGTIKKSYRAQLCDEIQAYWVLIDTGTI